MQRCLFSAHHLYIGFLIAPVMTHDSGKHAAGVAGTMPHDTDEVTGCFFSHGVLHKITWTNVLALPPFCFLFPLLVLVAVLVELWVLLALLFDMPAIHNAGLLLSMFLVVSLIDLGMLDCFGADNPLETLLLRDKVLPFLSVYFFCLGPCFWTSVILDCSFFGAVLHRISFLCFFLYLCALLF